MADDPGGLVYQLKAAYEQKRRELAEAIEEGRVADPVSLAITVGISLAASFASSAVVNLLTPRRTQKTGEQQGDLLVPQSSQGIAIPELYGADPASNASAFKPSHVYVLEDRVVFGSYFYIVTTAGTSGATPPAFPSTKGASVTSGSVVFTNYGRTGGGGRLGMLVVWTSGIQKRVTTTRGGGGGKLSPKQPDVQTTEYFLSLAIMPGRGPLHIRRITANTDTIYRDAFGPGTTFYEAEAGTNTKAGGAANVSDVDASNGSAVTVPQNGSLQWNQVYGDGEQIILEFYYKASASVSVEFTWTGTGVSVFTDTLNSTSGVYMMGYHSAPFGFDAGSVNTVKVKNLSAGTLTLDRLGVKVPGSGGLPTGVPNGNIPADDDYTPDTLPSPNTEYNRPLERLAGLLLEDGTGARGGTLGAGGHAGIVIHPGNQEQLPDSTIQADVDSTYGVGSTPAYKGRCLEVLTNFFLTKYGGAIPVINSIAEHQELDTLEGLCGHWCDRTGVLDSDDYDFSDVRRVFVRGIPVGPPYSPADVMAELARVYNVYFVETDKIRARIRGSQAPIATLTDADLGWVEGDSDESEDELQGLDADLATETEIPRRFELTFVDPERGWEQNSQGTSRQVTQSEKTEKIELAITLLAEEAREITQRELYEAHIESTRYATTLNWTYLWAEPGDTLIVEEDDGTTSRVFIETIRPNIGVIPVEGFAEELAVYEQPVSTSGGGVFEVPPVPIPAMSLWGVYDGPLLRDEENTINNGAGFISWALKRRGDGNFNGSVLYVDRGLDYEQLATFEREATAGVCVTALTATTTVHGIVADAVTVDLHDENATLESFTEEDLWAGAGAAIFGDEVCQILSATREPDTAIYPNRWYVTVGLRARRGTDFAINDHVAGERFVLINDALKFVPLNLNEKDVTRSYRMVTSGQSLDDAATIPFAWTGGSVKPLAPVHVKRVDGSTDDSLITLALRARMGHGIHGGLSGFSDVEQRRAEMVVYSDSSRATVVRTLPIIQGMSMAAVLESFYTGQPTNNFYGITANTLSVSGSLLNVTARSHQVIREAGNFVEGTLLYAGGGVARLALIGAWRDWRSSLTFSEIDFSVTADSGQLKIRVGSAIVHTQTLLAGQTARVRIAVSGTEVRFYLDWTGTGTPPLYVSPFAPAYPLIAWAYVDSAAGDSASVSDVIMTTYPDLATVYSAAQKTEDGLTPSATIYADLHEIDPRFGRGYPAEVVLDDSM